MVTEIFQRCGHMFWGNAFFPGFPRKFSRILSDYESEQSMKFIFNFVISINYNRTVVRILRAQVYGR